MRPTLVDANVLLDVVTEDPVWFPWSSEMLVAAAEASVLVINPVIYAEVSIRFERIEDLEAAIPSDMFRREPLPWEAAFLAGKCFLAYRRRGGGKNAPLPDFFIGAHAAVSGYTLLTRDPARYVTYFPGVKLSHPKRQG